jgi:hypothetical protein
MWKAQSHQIWQKSRPVAFNLASDIGYIQNSELPVILKNAADKGVRIFPILISPSLFTMVKYKYPDPKMGPQEFTLSSLQSVKPPTKTLVEMTEGEQNRVLLAVGEQSQKFWVQTFSR